MTYIKEFQIANLAGHKGTIHHVLDRSVNVFWGLNGTGKTTLLRILDAALSNSTAELDKLPFESAEVVFHSESRDLDVTRRYERGKQQKQSPAPSEPELDWNLLSHLDFDEDLARQIARSMESKNPWPTTLSKRAPDSQRAKLVNYAHRYLPISRIVEQPRIEKGSRLSTEERFARHVNSVWTRYSSQSLAQIRDIQQQGLAEVLAILFGGKSSGVIDGAVGEDDPTTPDAAYELVAHFLNEQSLELPLGRSDFVSRYSSEPNRHVVAKIKAVMKLVDDVLRPQRELQSVVDEMYIGNKHLQLSNVLHASNPLSVMIDDKSIAVSALSSGEKQLLHILLETLAIDVSTIMIDEPELSLHVDWQKRLVASMRRVNPQAQLILATHSPELMIDVDDHCVFEL